MSRFCFCNCPADFSAEPERHAPDCPGRSGAGKARTPVPATLTAFQPADSGVDFGIDGRSVRVSQEAYSIFLAREAAGREKIAALQQRLTAADEREDVLEGLLRDLIGHAEIYSSCWEFDQDTDGVELAKRIVAALKPAEAARCTNCDRVAVEQCDDAGCGFLGAPAPASMNELTQNPCDLNRDIY